MIDANVIALVTLTFTLTLHLVATVWWAASLTRRVDHIEKWIGNNAQTAERLAALEQQISNLSAGIARIEHYLRQTS
ncbi:MAG: hypothetical protein OXT65_08685 [Alphaproteobacteria bacterium]|nr:hypothetical protein [Alphaproteobacteria bacterium]